MAVFRILEARVRPGAAARVLELLGQQQRDIVASAPGVVFVQSLRSGDQVLAVSSWESEEDLQRYLDQAPTREFYRALPEHLMGTPSVRTYEVVGFEGDGPGWSDGGSQAEGRAR
jgi:heme-degrading monooxygenase HmoA